MQTNQPQADSNHVRSPYILPLSKGLYPLRIEYADEKEDYTFAALLDYALHHGRNGGRARATGTAIQ